MGNGSLPASDLVLVQKGIYLHRNAASSWSAARAAGLKAYGVAPYITSPYGGYRTLAQQWAMWNNRTTSTNGLVAYPGTSVHGWGMCVDVGNYRTFTPAQLDAAMKVGGFTRTIKGELWHYQKTTNGGASAGGISQEELMSIFDDAYPAPNPAQPGAWIAVWFTPTFGAVKLTSEEWGAVQRIRDTAKGAAIESYADVQVASRLIQRASLAGIVAQIDDAIDDEAILAKPGATFDIDYTKFDIPTVEEIAQGVRDELIAPDA